MSNTTICFGEVLWDLLPDAPALGGAALNFAYRLHNLGNKALIVSAVSDDDLGIQARERIEALGLSTQHLQIDSVHPTGTVPVDIVNGQPRYTVLHDVAYDFITTNKPVLEAAKAAKCIYFGTLAQREPLSRNTLGSILDSANRAIKFLDLNLRDKCFTPGTVSLSLHTADIVQLNEHETDMVSTMFRLPQVGISDFGHRLVRDYALNACIITEGQKGAWVFARTGDEYFVKSYSVEVVDTVGSGDAFAAGFVHKYLSGSSLPEAADFGNIMGALSSSKPGGTSEITLDEIAQFKKAHS